jgi:FkbM family methyltransferase
MTGFKKRGVNRTVRKKSPTNYPSKEEAGNSQFRQIAVANSEKIDYDPNLLERVLTQWDFGDWVSLVQVQPENIKDHPERVKLALLIGVGWLQQNNTSLAKSFFQLAQNWGGSKGLICSVLVSGVYNNLGRAAAISGQMPRAIKYFECAIRGSIHNSDIRLITQARVSEQLRQIGLPTSFGESRGLFIDCGGYDGCSVIKFLLKNPNFDVVTFEPNPDLWDYYESIPTLLVKKAVATHDGEVEFIIDPVDGDGSSYVKTKNVVFDGSIQNINCPTIFVKCVDLSRFIKNASQYYNRIFLKLDIEGAEYEILEHMLNDGALSFVTKIYCEFHWNKIGMSIDQHNDLLKRLIEHVDINKEEWDALGFSAHQAKSSYSLRMRKALLDVLNSREKSINLEYLRRCLEIF